MFNLFKKKSIEYPSESKWSIHQGQNEGKPMFVRRNDSARPFVSSSGFSYRIGVAIPFQNPNEAGLPPEEEIKKLNEIEDAMCNFLEKEQKSLLVLTITTNGMREFIFYTEDPQGSEHTIDLLRSQYPAREIQSYIAEDRKWALFKQFC